MILFIRGTGVILCYFISYSLLLMLAQDALSKVSPVAYVDILDGDVECHVRFHTPEDATAISNAKEQLLKEHSWKLEILKGQKVSSLICRERNLHIMFKHFEIA